MKSNLTIREKKTMLLREKKHVNIYQIVAKGSLMLKLIRNLGWLLLLLAAIVQLTNVYAQPIVLSIQGPDTLTDQQVGVYRITNPTGEKLDIYSTSGIWIRSLVAYEGVTCGLKDEGTLDTITCNGSFTVSVSSDYGQQLQFVLGSITKLVSAAGTLPEPDESEIHIYNGWVPSPPAVETAASLDRPATITNVVEGGYAEYLLTAINWTGTMTRTYSITLNIPATVTITRAPNSCVASTNKGQYACQFVVGPQSWHEEGFEVQWTKAGRPVMWARGLVAGVEVGYNERVGNVIRVEHFGPRQYLPLLVR